MRDAVVSMLGLAAILLVFAGTASGNDAQDEFTYQGKLVLNGTPVNDTCDLDFSLWDDPVAGTWLFSAGATVTVSDGLFTANVAIPTHLFNGDNRWLQIWVCCPTGTCPTDPDWSKLDPRQKVTSAPYAMALPAMRIQQNATCPAVIGGFTTNEVVDGVESATISGGGDMNFPHRVTDAGGTIGGGIGNQAGSDNGDLFDAEFATVGGGRANFSLDKYATIGGGYGNEASGQGSTVSGGQGNNVEDNFGAIGGGGASSWPNPIVLCEGGPNAGEYCGLCDDGVTECARDGDCALGESCNPDPGQCPDGNCSRTTEGPGNRARGEYCTVGGGSMNVAGSLELSTTDYATVGGGLHNIAKYEYSTVGGGSDNAAYGLGATVGGGHNNVARGESCSTIGGGVSNNVYDHGGTIGGGLENRAGTDGGLSDAWATVGGGVWNVAGAYASTVPGGQDNRANGQWSFAAGVGARADHDGCFVWADASSGLNFHSDAANRFMVRAQNGSWFENGSGDWVQFCAFYTISTSTGAYLSASGVWTDAPPKGGLRNESPTVDSSDVLDKLADLPIRTWEDEGNECTARHMTPTPEDFHAAFGLGEDDEHIAALDTSGVALAAVQGLYEVVKEKDAKIAELEARLAKLEKLMNQTLPTQNGGGR